MGCTKQTARKSTGGVKWDKVQFFNNPVENYYSLVGDVLPHSHAQSFARSDTSEFILLVSFLNGKTNIHFEWGCPKSFGSVFF